jgi:glycerol-3-phosphate O-acyltransferase/dihydroxyacetone phosphate acyltransferase
MGYNRALRDFDGHADVTKTQLAILCIIIYLTVDAINPVKIVLHVFPQIAAWQVVVLCALIMAYLVVTEIKSLLYFTVKVFFHSILSIFFREVHVIGLENVPQYGPVIFTGNHANQFIDAVTMVCTCQRTISYLVAEKSWNRRIIGHLAWALGAVPVKRAQDSAIPGVGQVFIKPLSPEEQQDNTDKETNNAPKIMLVQGFKTEFVSQIKVRDKIRFAGTTTGLTVQQIISDTELKVEIVDESIQLPSEQSNFVIFKRVDQGEVYSAVLNRLGENGCIGIFPEGGSHDRSDLLPLKVGVALIAYSALERDGINIPIVPVGLNYFNAHRFRGRAIVEFGAPLFIDPNTLDSFKQGGKVKREVCNDLLER